MKVVKDDLEDSGLERLCEWIDTHFIVEMQRMRRMRMNPLGVKLDWS